MRTLSGKDKKRCVCVCVCVFVGACMCVSVEHMAVKFNRDPPQKWLVDMNPA